MEQNMEIEALEELSLSGSSVGETQSLSSGTSLGNMDFKARTYFFTWNNYPNDWEKRLKKLNWNKIACQEGIGQNSTKHIQGVIYFKNARHRSAIRKEIPEMWFEKCKNLKKAIEYCNKLDTRNGKILNFGFEINFHRVKDLYNPLIATKWQTDILDVIKEEPDPRKIYWIWESLGNTGKTTLAKHICIENEDSICLSGKAADMKYGIIKFHENKAYYPKIILLDIPRSLEGYISYSGIEAIKNGLFFSTKYESSMAIFNAPHIIIFANFYPEVDRLSLDRWEILTLSKRDAERVALEHKFFER